MKIDILVTHANCPDGKTCGWLMNAYDKNVKVIYAQYGNEEKVMSEIPSGSDVLFADFTLPLVYMEELEKRVNIIAVLDHHKTAEETLRGKPYSMFNMNKCGSMLLLEYLNLSRYHKIVEYVCDRDLWTWKLYKSKEFSAGYSLKDNTETIDELNYKTPTTYVNDCIKDGDTLIKKLNNEVLKVINNTKDTNVITFTIDNVRTKMWLINNNHNISEVGNELSLKERSDGLIYSASCQYFITETDIVFSLRAIDDVDISVIAKAFGGGGHKLAAGFSIKLEDFISKDGFNSILNIKGLNPNQFSNE